MSDHIHHDDENVRLHIGARWAGGVLLSALDETDTVHVGISDDQMPDVLAALLEKFGVESIDPAEPDASATPERLALYWLYQWQGLRKAQAEREAEDAKAKAYRDALFPNAIKWEHLDEEIRESHRARYRVAREFFARAEGAVTVPAYASDPAFEQLVDLASRARDESLKPAPRVLNYGDPEPDRDTKWARPAMEMHFDGDYWALFTDKGNIIGYYKWASLPPYAFPMTEVTE